MFSHRNQGNLNEYDQSGSRVIFRGKCYRGISLIGVGYEHFFSNDATVAKP